MENRLQTTIKAAGQGFSPADNTAPSPLHDKPTQDNLMPTAGATRSTDELLDPTRVAAVRKANLDGQLKSNFWFEVSRIALWATTGLIAMTVGIAAGAVHLAPIALGAVTLGPIVLPLVGAIVAAGVLIASSQHSKNTFANRWFDVQDFQMQRQAALTGKAVQQGVEAAETNLHAPTKRWTDDIKPRNATISQVAALAAEQQSASAAQR